jgi:uncharacterized protein (TIGR02594 family)
MKITALDLAERFLGLAEIPGAEHNNLIAAMTELVLAEARGDGLTAIGRAPADDETPWCSAFMGWLGFLLDLPRPATSQNPTLRRIPLRARSWLLVGESIELADVKPGWDICVFNRGGPHDDQVINAPGHVGLYLRNEAGMLWVRGGNQGNRVSDRPYAEADLLGVQRWWSEP